MNPTLIKANIALFNGSRAEARRLLRDYEAQTAAASIPDEASLVLWLSAQAQDNREARVDALRKLQDTVPASDPYARLAAQYLADEQKAEAVAATDVVTEDGEPAPPQRGQILGVPLWKAGAFALAGVIVGVIVMTLFSGGSSAGRTVVVAPTPLPGTTVPGTPPPDLSTPIPAELHQTDYPDGILQITRIEEGSQRIVDERGNLVTPVAGARFVALKMLFECRAGTGGICRNPPEANIALVLDDFTQAPRLSDVSVIGEPQLSQVAAGNTTDGWVVFEVPQSRAPLSVAVFPLRPVATPALNEEQQPQIIVLPGALVEVTPDDGS